MALAKRLDEMAWRNVGFIRSLSDQEYARELLEARRDFLRLRLRHEISIRQIYVRAAEQVAQELRGMPPGLTRNHLLALEKTLSREAEKINASVSALAKSGMNEAVGLGARPIDSRLFEALNEAIVPISIARIQRGFGDVNSAAVEALWARTYKGLNLSQRIWDHSQSARDAMRDIIHTGVAAGRDPVKVARDLERYVRQGSATLAEDYPNMMARMGRRVPKDLCYESLRLTRTEYSKAYMEGTYSRGRVNPSYHGVRWMLSDAHNVAMPDGDICDDIAEANLYNLGPGVYPVGEEPVHPHPNCLCYVVPYLVDTDTFVLQLKKWKDDPESQPSIEKWYTDFYRNLI